MTKNEPTTAELMRVSFPKRKPAPLEGRPTMKGLVSLLPYLRDCAKSHRVYGRDMGLLHLVIRAILYANYTAQSYPVRQADPGQLPLFAPGADTAQQRTAELQHALAYKFHADEETMNQCLIEEVLSLLSADTAQDIRDQMASMANPTFIQVYDLAHIRYGGTNPSMNMANRQSMTADWSPEDGISKLTRRIDQAAEFAQFAQAPISEEDKMDAALFCINRTGAYRQSYIAWKTEPNRTWLHLKHYFDEADRVRVEVDQEAGTLGFGMAGTEGGGEQKTWDNTFTQFSAAHAANLASMQALAEANAQHTNNIGATLPQLQGQLQNLQQQLCMLANSAPQQNQQRQQQYAPQGYAPAQPRGRGSRRNGRGGGAYGQAGQQNQWNSAGGYGRGMQMPPSGGGRQSYPQHPVKRYENWWYCHSCGCDVDHESANCPRPRQGHMWNATRNNRMGGCNKQNHKTTLPSQVGSQGLRVRDTNRGFQQQRPAQQQQMAHGMPMSGQQFAPMAPAPAPQMGQSMGPPQMRPMQQQQFWQQPQQQMWGYQQRH